MVEEKILQLNCIKAEISQIIDKMAVLNTSLFNNIKNEENENRDKINIGLWLMYLDRVQELENVAEKLQVLEKLI